MLNRRHLPRLLMACVGLAFAISAQAGSIRPKDDNNEPLDWVPSGKGHGEPDAKGPKRVDPNNPTGQAKLPGSGTITGYGINYHGGPLITGTTKVYYIWYGNWTGNTATTILTDLAQNIGPSSRYNINTSYSVVGKTIQNSVLYANATNDLYSQGTVLSDAGVKTVVANAITSGRLPKDSNAVYFVLTSADVNESSGFCTSYCGWHTHATISRADIKYAFVGNPDRCPSACEGQTASSPNSNPGADGMASVIVHELEEAVTDPDLNAWYDSKGYENADKCAWTFGTTYTAANGSKANMQLGGRDFYIQQNWANAAPAGYCTLNY